MQAEGKKRGDTHKPNHHRGLGRFMPKKSGRSLTRGAILMAVGEAQGGQESKKKNLLIGNVSVRDSNCTGAVEVNPKQTLTLAGGEKGRAEARGIGKVVSRREKAEDCGECGETDRRELQTGL